MATAVQKITLSPSRDIPFNKLVLSQSNVRRVKTGVSIEELAEDIARRTLLQSLNVRPVLDGEGGETGMFEVPAGGRRFRALELLVKQKRLAKTAPIPCVVRDPATDILAEDDSLAENLQRAPLHPLDQFRAFQAMRLKGLSEEDIAAAFFTSANVVKQRLRLASVVAITGASFAPDAPAWRDAFVHLQARGRVVFTAAIGGAVYAKHGTTIETRLTVIDKVPADDPGTFPASPGMAPDVATLLGWIGTHIPPRPPVASAAVIGTAVTSAPRTVRSYLARTGVASGPKTPTADPEAIELAYETISAYGLFHEIISWKLRMFVPTDASGAEVMTKLLERYSKTEPQEKAA